MAKFDFLSRCNGLDWKNIPPSTMKKLAKYTKREDFNREVVMKKSAAAAALCDWVLSVEKLSKDYKL